EEEMIQEIETSIRAGYQKTNPFADFVIGDMSEDNYDRIDLHKNVVDEIILVSPSGKPMKREADLIDVWFDSGSMPYAQWHYPFSLPPAPSKGRGAFGYQTADKLNYELLAENAQKNKDNITLTEQIVWAALKGKKVEGYIFRTQHIVHNYIVDFVCVSRTVVVEIDGGYHNKYEGKEKDKERVHYLKDRGYAILR